MTAKNFIDRSGQKIGHWFVESLDSVGGGPTQWLCTCLHCGKKKVWRIDAVLLQKAKSRHLCPCRKNGKDRELAKSLAISEARTGATGPHEESDLSLLTKLRDQNGRQDTRPAMYRKRPKRSGSDQGAAEAWSYSRSGEMRGWGGF